MISYRWYRRLWVFIGYRSFFNATMWPSVTYLLVSGNASGLFIETIIENGYVEEFID